MIGIIGVALIGIFICIVSVAQVKDPVGTERNAVLWLIAILIALHLF